MTKDDIKELFGVDEVIKISKKEFVRVEVFLDLFRDLPKNPSFDHFLQIDDGELGYADFFC